MYTHGYDLRHFATMGIVPASVEMIVHGWWLCKSFESNGEKASIAATALEHDIPLITNNVGHYAGVEDLTVVAEISQPE
jgi:predicted nucleic acid-binding protein